MRKLASIQKVLELNPIAGADMIECASILGWRCVVRKGEFVVGGYGVFHEIDSVLPERPEYEFMRPRGFRVKTMKLRGCLSQGLLLPLSVVPTGVEVSEGVDVSEALGIVKYEPPYRFKNGDMRCPFPFFVPKTDEVRIQSEPGLLADLQGRPYYISQKLDGTSATFVLDVDGRLDAEKDLHCCSRNLSVKEGGSAGADGDNVYWQVARKYGIADGLQQFPRYALQGEIVGPSIQGNKLKLKEVDFRLFDVYDTEKQEYLGLMEMCYVAGVLGLPSVPILEEGPTFGDTVDQLVEKSKGKYDAGGHQEGIVIRSVAGGPQGGRPSFKCINPDFLLAGGD